MKQILTAVVIILGLTVPASAQPANPFAIASYGNFKKMMHTGITDGVVNLREALDLPHVYGVGAIAHGTGEITVVDGRVWLDYGADGPGNAEESIPADAKAVLLVRAQVEEWLSVKVPEDMGSQELHVFILAQAEAHGLDTGKPFPFLLEGEFYDVDWHVVNGKRTASEDHVKHFGIYNKAKGHRDQTGGTVLGFYSASSQGVYTHPGESWHLHIVFAKEDMAGHLDRATVKQGTVLKLPASRD